MVQSLHSDDPHMPSQTHDLLQTLKQQLKAHGHTYADVAKALALSEASVKRLFSTGHMSLHRLNQICAMIRLDFADLVHVMESSQRQVSQLSLQQEEAIVKDTDLLLVALSAIHGLDFEAIVDNYAISESNCIQKLAALDRLGIIDLLPNNKIKKRVATNFAWLPDGPIQKFFQHYVAQDFFRSRFNADTEKMLVLNGPLTPETNRKIQQLMDEFVHTFNQLMQDESHLESDKKYGNTMVLAIRQWRYALFDEKRRAD